MIGYITALYALAAATLVIAGQDKLVQCTPGEYEIIGKADCTGYYLCVFGNPVEMPPCPPGSVFSSSSNVCVPKGSIYDDCKKTTDGSGSHITESPDQGHLSPVERCNRDGNGVFHHPTECQAFYNCSVRYTPEIPRFFEQHLVECPYPQLFNTETKQCDHFENVKCGTRTEFKDGCQYKSNMCGSSHCIPCNVRLPSCEGKRDGINIHPVKIWTPFYVVCYKERTVKEDRCKVDENGRTQLFHPEKNECVSLDMIPREHGGMMPECGTKVDGFYLDDFGRCDRYVHCQGRKYIGTIKCAVGEAFDDTKGGCVPEEKACGPCGKLDHC
ncbi:uncharacterized protein LOC128216371 [Mya arenaria]|uniref:uncharacterized protein LOC128216371 n=1 Tax=Mya arenaria TaxID=6604 RepID=UPI0022E8BE07|nr:uncharacterized protein LOC128216371 [Mya arenaria]